MRFQLLGPLAIIRDDGSVLHIPAHKRRALMAVLLLNANRVVPTDDLVEALWGDEAPPSALTSLHAHVSRLRRELPSGVIQTASGGYRVSVKEDDLDLARFERLAAAASGMLREGRYAGAAASLAEALELWRGDPLADLAGEPFAVYRLPGLSEARLRALEDRIEADMHLGRHAQLVGELERLTREHPLREHFWQQLMLALYRSGRQADALAAYRRLRDQLVEQLGIDPSPEVQELERRILRQDPDVGPKTGTLAGPAVRLPSPAPRLVGREAEMEEVPARLATQRLVTLIGPGGVGKTSLAVEVAHRLVPEFDDGVMFVDLSPVRDPALVVPTIGQEIGAGERPWEVILDRRLLLVLDNFEQVLDAAPSIADLLDRCAGLRLLVTSRAPLRVRAEGAFEVPPLSLADGEELFAIRARDAMRQWQADDSELTAIVGKLDGLPLAIELTAARMATFAPAALLQALERPLDVMARGPRDAPRRHQALRNAIAWSYGLLSEQSRVCIRGLSVFAGGFDMPAATFVVGATMDTLGELVEHSLVRRDGGRYSLLETIREFASELGQSAGDGDATRDRHLAYYTEQVSAASRQADVEAERDWFAICTRERDNLRAAFDWAVATNDGAAILRLAQRVGIYWLIVGSLQEGERWWQAGMLRTSTDRPAERAAALMIVAEFPRWAGRHEEAIEVRSEAIALARAAEEPELLATLLGDTAWSLGALGRLEEAEAALNEAMELRRTMPEDHMGMSHTLGHVGWLRIRQGRAADALRIAVETEASDERADGLPPQWSTETLDLKAAALLACGRLNEAEEKYRQVLEASARMEFRITSLDALIGLATIAATYDATEAVRLLGTADRVRAQSGLAPFDLSHVQRLADFLRRKLGDAKYNEHWLSGQAASA